MVLAAVVVLIYWPPATLGVCALTFPNLSFCFAGVCIIQLQWSSCSQPFISVTSKESERTHDLKNKKDKYWRKEELHNMLWKCKLNATKKAMDRQQSKWKIGL